MFYLFLLVAGALAWMISTVAAGGAAMLLIPILGLTLHSQSVAPVITVASLMANPSRTFVFWNHIYWPAVRWLLPGSLIGAVAGAVAFTQVPAELLQLILGVFLLSTIWQYRFGKRKKSFPDAVGRLSAPRPCRFIYLGANWRDRTGNEPFFPQSRHGKRTVGCH